MRFLVDMPLSPALAAWLREQGHDALHAAELAPHRAPDSEIMTRAKQEERTIVAADLDYPQLLATAQATDPSVILFRDGDWSEAEIVRRMAEVLAALTETDVEQSIVVIEKMRVRRRRLPLTS